MNGNKLFVEEPSRFVIRLANIIFLLGIFFSIFFLAYASYKIYSPSETVTPIFYIITITFSGVSAVLFSIGLKRLDNNLKVSLSVMFFSIGIAIYGFEVYLEFSHKVNHREVRAKQMNIPFDTRTRLEVLNDLKNAGVDAYPNIFPYIFIQTDGLASNKGRIQPLGGISNITIIGRPESGYYPIIETDEYGFNNPKGLYKKNKIDILLTGDSFLEGYFVNPDETISSVLRKMDFNTINVGKGGNGPLMELATLNEYAKPLKPKIVLWLYYVNDSAGLLNEMKSSILQNYLKDDDYSQNLIFRQEEIDSSLKNYVQILIDKQKNKENKKVKKNKNIKIINVLKLTKLRTMINFKPSSSSSPIFKNILQRSNQIISNWDGKLYFVYLPSYERYSTGKEDSRRDSIMQTAMEVNIPIIDIHSEVFATHPDPLSLFPFKMNGHYTAEALKLIAETISERINADGYTPIKSTK